MNKKRESSKRRETQHNGVMCSLYCVVLFPLDIFDT